MKLTTTLLAAVLFTAFSFSAIAQNSEATETVAKILPHKEAGFVKVLYMSPSSKTVLIKFHGKDGVIIRDYVKNTDGGFTKVYDLNELPTGNYTVEIIDKGMSVKYPLNYNKYHQVVWAAQWQDYKFESTLATASKD